MISNLDGEPVVSPHGRLLTLRPSDRNPRSPFCKLHLQRVCGTCAHFDGHLRQVEAGACGVFAVEVMPGNPAGRCASWSRKVAEGQQ